MTFSGHLELEGRRVEEGRTQVGRQSFSAPFHISKPYWDGRVLQVQIVNPTAGILEGDALRLELSVREGASLQVSTPSAARAFMMRGGAAGCVQTLDVERGGWLEYAPEPLYPHAGTCYSQQTLLRVAEGGRVCFVDTLAPGRAARGELWAWDRLAIGLRVELGGRPVVVERLQATGPQLGELAKFNGFSEAWFGTVVLVAPELEAGPEWWAPLETLHGEGRWFGCTRPAPGVAVLRIVAPGAISLREALGRVREHCAAVLPGLGAVLRGAPLAR